MVTFRLSDFKRKLLKLKNVDLDKYGIAYEPDTKFKLGVQYAMALDPGFKYPTEMSDTFKFYFVDDDGVIIKANDSNLFHTPSVYPDNVVCEMDRSIIRKQNCSVVYFTFTAAHPFPIEMPITSIICTTLCMNFDILNSFEKNALLVDYSKNDEVYPINGVADHWVITNDVYELKAIDVFEAECDEDDEFDDDDDNEDSENSDEPDDDSGDDDEE